MTAVRGTFALAVASMLLLGCGSSKSDGDQVRDAITGFYKGKDAGACTRVATPHYLVRIFGGTEKEALAECKKTLAGETGVHVKIGRVTVKGARATASASYPTRNLILSLAKRDGSWKLADVTNLGEDPHRAANEIARCLKSRGLKVQGPEQKTFAKQPVPVVFATLPSGGGMGIAVYAFGNGKNFAADVEALVKRESKPTVSYLKTKRGPRIIIFENRPSSSEKLLSEACLPEIEDKQL